MNFGSGLQCDDSKSLLPREKGGRKNERKGGNVAGAIVNPHDCRETVRPPRASILNFNRRFDRGTEYLFWLFGLEYPTEDVARRGRMRERECARETIYPKFASSRVRRLDTLLFVPAAICLPDCNPSPSFRHTIATTTPFRSAPATPIYPLPAHAGLQYQPSSLATRKARSCQDSREF